MKRILITGASGFVGRHSLAPAAKRGYEVHAVTSRRPSKELAVWHQADLLDPVERDRLLEEVRPTHLLHFAWYTAHRAYWTSTENLRWVEASLALLRGFADRGGRRAVIAGTCAEYDWRFGYCSEVSTPAIPSSLYGISKNALQCVASSFAGQIGLSLAWGRIFFPYGPHENPRRLVPSVIGSLLKGEPVRCSHGNQYRDFLYVADCGDAFAALLDSDVQGVVNIGSGRPRTIKDIVQVISAAIPAGSSSLVEFGAIPAPPDDPPLLVADVRRLTQEVGWSPSFGIEDGIAETVRSYMPKF